MGTVTIHQAVCDRCGKFEEVDEPEGRPESWSEIAVPIGTAEIILCHHCLVQLDLWLKGANIRKPRTKVALGSSPLSAVPDAPTP